MKNRLPATLGLALLPLLTMACSSADNPTDPGNINPATAPSASLAGSSAEARTAKVDICHRTDGTNTFIALSVAAPAVEPHVAHGDASPGQAVPGQPGMMFAADCTSTASVRVITVTGRWTGSSYLFDQLFTLAAAGTVDATATVTGITEPLRLALLTYSPVTNTCGFTGTFPVSAASTPPVLSGQWEEVPAGTYCLNVVLDRSTPPVPAPYQWTATISYPQ